MTDKVRIRAPCRQEYVVKDGDRLRIGDHLYVLRATEDGSAAWFEGPLIENLKIEFVLLKGN